MDIQKLKQMVLKACGNTLQVKRIMVNPKPEDEKKLMKLCTVPGYKHFIIEFFKSLKGEPITVGEPLKDIVTDEPIIVEEKPEDEEPKEEVKIVSDDEDSGDIQISTEEQIGEAPVEETAKQPVEETGEDGLFVQNMDEQIKVPDEYTTAETTVETTEEVTEEQPEEKTEEKIEETTDEVTEEVTEEQPEEKPAKKQKGRGKRK